MTGERDRLDSDTMIDEAKTVFVLTGLTSSGKKKVGVEVAAHIDAEIISLDSMKVYRGMDIGTAKPGGGDRSRAVFHMLDLVDPSDSFSAGKFLEIARELVEDIHCRGRRVLFLGGTAFYLNSLLNGLFAQPASDPAVREGLMHEARERGTAYLHGRLRGADPSSADDIHPNDLKRIVRALEVIQTTGKPLSWLKEHRTVRIIPNPARTAALRWPATVLEKRIRDRTTKMIAQGLVDEVRGILEGGGFGPESSKAIGYREIIAHLEGSITLDEAAEAISRNTLRFVKKQETWYRRFDSIRWFELQSAGDLPRVVEEMARYFRA
jgi:tRNA dimethylallyltransferase